MKKERPILLIGSSHSSKPKKNWSKKGKEKGHLKGKIKPKGGVKKPKQSLIEKGNFFHCGKLGHWKRNYKINLAELKQKCFDLGIYFVEINLSVNDASWVLDIECGSIFAMICN